MFRVSVTAKLAASYLLVAALIVGPTLAYLRASFLTTLEQLEAATVQPLAEALRDELEVIPADQPAELEATVRRFARLLQMRVTVIDRAGVPLHDSEIPQERIGTLENHGGRPEVREALAGRYGWARRVSTSVHEELFYGAVPLPAKGPPVLVVRVARRVAGMREAAINALLTMRLSTGVGVTVALLLSLGAAVYVSSPLRRMRDAARAFADGRWVEVRRLHTRDELEDLSIALDELARRLQEQLISHGANEALLAQTIRALPCPAILLDADFKPLEVNGALRELGDLVPANEGEALTSLLRAPTLEAARREATERGLPSELTMPLPGRPEEGHVPGTLVPLTRPVGPPFWVLFIAQRRELEAERGGVPLIELLERADRVIDSLWAINPAARRELAELRAHIDALAAAHGRPEAAGVAPRPLGELMERAIEEVRAMHPDRPVVAFAPADPAAAIKIAESSGLALRSLRALLRIASRGVSSHAPELMIEVQPAAVRVDVRGAAASEPGDDGRLLECFAEALGGSVGRKAAGERAVLRLNLPRA
jgi:HAMP domain-containing protein